MRNLRLLVACVAISGLLLAAGCGDDSGTDTETDCTDGIDNDGDNVIDCLDSDCAGHPNCACNFNSLCEPALGETTTNCTDCTSDPVCGNGTCEVGETETNCAADCSAGTCGDGTCNPGEDAQNCPQDCAAGDCSTEADLLTQDCPTGEACDLNQQTSVIECRAEGTVANYAACTASTDCLAGAGCYTMDGTTTNCHPYCSGPGGTCPPDGVCAATLQSNPNVYICVEQSNACDPVDNTGCTAPEVCFLFAAGASCAAPSTNPAAAGQPCDQGLPNGCVEGVSCFGDSEGGTQCLELCHLSDNTGCESGTCTTGVIQSDDFGVCQ